MHGDTSKNGLVELIDFLKSFPVIFLLPVSKEFKRDSNALLGLTN